MYGYPFLSSIPYTGIRTIFAGSSCNDLVPSDSAATTIISGHFDKKIRFWDTRTEQSANEVPLQGKITSLCLSRGWSLDFLSSFSVGKFGCYLYWYNVFSVLHCLQIMRMIWQFFLNVSFSDGFYLLSCVRDDSLKILDLRKNQVVNTFT